MKDVTTCTICNLNFNGLLKKKIHEQQVHIWIFQCDVCQTKFKTNEDLETHRLIHNKKISEHKEETPVKKLKKNWGLMEELGGEVGPRVELGE